MGKKVKNLFGKSTLIFIVAAALLIISLLSQAPQNFVKRQQLIHFYSKITSFDKTRNWEELYYLLSPEQRRKISLNDFVLVQNQRSKATSSEFTVRSYEVEGDKGIIDRILVNCYSTDCTGNNRSEQGAKKEYAYINGSWYIPEDNTVLCDRDLPYAQPPEFDRALSLIIQRLDNSQYLQGTTFEEEDRSSANLIKKLRNCFDIQYASSESDLEGAEGVFYFDKNSDNNDLKILVSPNYKTKDDLLTATLLRHELQHAVYYATGQANSMSCFENEARAFAVEVSFYLGSLNQEEQNSIYNRYNISPEAKNLIDLSNFVLANSKKAYDEATMMYVENSPFYQTQCTGRNAPIVVTTPISISPTLIPPKKVFNTQACINAATITGKNCINNCTNQADANSQSCPTNDIVKHQNCLNQLLALSDNCNSNCVNASKNTMDNCARGISP